MNILRIVATTSVKNALNAVMLDSSVGYSTRVDESCHIAGREVLCESLDAAPWDTIANPASVLRPRVVICDKERVAGISKRVFRQAGGARHIVLGINRDSGSWTGMCWTGNYTEPLDGVCIVAAGMPQLYLDGARRFQTDDDLTRYSRLSGAIGNVAYRIRSLRVMVVGAGRNGSAVLRQLALLGVGALTIVDRDVLHTENLDATFGVGPSQVGLSKVRAVAESLCSMRDDLSITCLEKSASHRDVLEAARTTDLIVSCVDNDAPRLAAAKIARKLLRPHLDIGTGVVQQTDGTRLIAGDARLLMPGDGCVCCVGGLRNRRDAEFELVSPPDALRRGKPVAWHQERMGSLITINSMTVSIGVQLWLDLLSGSLPGSTWHRIRWIEGHGLESHSAPVGASAVCDICNRW